MTTDQVIEYIKHQDVLIKHFSTGFELYKDALTEIQQIGINESDSVLAATEMEKIASDALK